MGANDPQCTGERLREAVTGADSLTIIAPFIKAEPLARLLEATDPEADIVVYTRWRLHEVAAGVSDTAVFDLVQERDGQLLLHPLLHAKLYLTAERGLAGSSNLTGAGLGWSSAPSIELLFPVAIDDPAVAALLTVLNQASCAATEAVREALDEQVASVEGRPLVSSRTLDENPAPSPYWIPRFKIPASAWAAYNGRRPEGVCRLVQRDLAGLGLPENIETEPEFNAAVGTALAQGFTGRLLLECAGLGAVAASHRFKNLLQEVGVEVPPDELEARYRAFVEWAGYFLSDATLRATGFSIA